MEWLCHVKILYFFALVGLSYSQTCPSDLDAEVIIVGAGMSGISAAQQLQESEITNILILEGSNSVGGRVESTEFGGVRLSMGATWIQGLDSASPELHPLWQIAQRCNNGSGLGGIYQDGDSYTYFNSQGRELTDDSLRWDDLDNAKSAVQELVAQLDARGDCGNISLRYGLNVSGWNPMNPEDDWVEWSIIDFCTGEKPEDLDLCLEVMGSTFTSFTSPDTERGQCCFITDPNGFESIIQCISDEVLRKNQTRIQFNSVVTDIDWRNDECVCVMVGNEQYCSRYAILTASIGVLQTEGAITFVPELPSWKREVINRFDMARYGHIIMEFDSIFWNDTEHIAYIDDTRGYYPVFLTLNNIFPQNPKMLMADITGDLVDTALSQPAAAISEIEQILSKLYPTSNTTVVNWLIPNWRDNPLTRGAYSYGKLGLVKEDFGLLAASLGNLYFTGEATSANFSGFVHGAFAGIFHHMNDSIVSTT